MQLELVTRLRQTALGADHERLDEYGDQFTEYCERAQEVCRLLHHTSTTETTQITSKQLEHSLEVYGQQLIAACHTLAVHSNSKIAKENLDVFADVWHLLTADLAQLAREVSELVRGCPQLENSVYLPQQRMGGLMGAPGQMVAQGNQMMVKSTQPFGASHMTNQMVSGGGPGGGSPVVMGPGGQQMVGQQGLVKGNPGNPRYSDDELKGGAGGVKSDDTDMGTDEGKGYGSGTDSEDNDIARKAKSMAAMAASMFQFTRGEGELKTTQDLFTQAEFFADEANKLYKIVRHFTYQIPSGPHKKELLDNLDKVPASVQQLQFAVKIVTVGKAATFTKVDSVVQNARNLMTVITLVASNVANCANKSNVDIQGALRTRSRTLSPSLRSDTEMYYEGSGGMGMKGGTATSDPDI
ncbi:unnamed protein product [Medioppia subpectinata]|uniref:Alpha-catulin n=1 Tax=Medioppia subpectinata TaxID=1979941 RepID=A0A7R9KPK9_9ACAR|nr:unnamed protein product [Medioppia subpectinata]CAG2107471.1 unnamed protein product [Medioppia subpectinata]